MRDAWKQYTTGYMKQSMVAVPVEKKMNNLSPIINQYRNNTTTTTSTPEALPTHYRIIELHSQSTVSEVTEEPETAIVRAGASRYLEMTKKSTTKKTSSKKETSSSQKQAKSKGQLTLTSALRAQYKEEKSLISFCTPTCFQNLTGAGLWGTVRHIDWKSLYSVRQSLGSEDKMYPGLSKILETFDKDLTEQLAKGRTMEQITGEFRSIARRLVICPSCFSNDDLPLARSIITTTNANSYNISQHRESNHAEQYFGGYVFPNLFADSASSLASGTAVSQQTSISRFAKNLPNRLEAKVVVRNAIFRCVNDLGFPATTVEKPAFREMLRHVFDNAQVINMKDVELSHKAINRMRIEGYNRFVRVVNDLRVNIRQHFTKLCGKPVPFATVCHDIWQGYKKDVLGVSLFFCDPRNVQMYKVPIGLVNTNGHTAEQVANITHKLMMTFGFTQKDLCASVNDNTNAAVLAGKYIVGTDNKGKCDMHKADLIVKHATGIATRKKKGVIVDSNPSFVDLYVKFYKFFAWLW